MQQEKLGLAHRGGNSRSGCLSKLYHWSWIQAETLLALQLGKLVSHLIVPLSAALRLQPAAGPVHVQCVLSRAQNVQCKSALRGPVPCWRRKCQVVSTPRTGWAPPDLDTAPTRTSSLALYPDEGAKKFHCETQCVSDMATLITLRSCFCSIKTIAKFFYLKLKPYFLLSVETWHTQYFFYSFEVEALIMF